MSVLFQTLINSGKLHSFKKLFIPPFAACKCLQIRKASDVPKKFISFDEVVAQRRAEARRSIVVQVNSEASYKELYNYCTKFATVNGIHHYKNSGGEHFMLVEFSTEDNLKDVIRSCCAHQKDLDVMALQSPFVWFRATTGKKEKFGTPERPLATVNGTSLIDEDTLSAELMACETLSDQIQLLYDRTILNDLGFRLRYVVARQLECVFDSLYANVLVHPFGSSVNGFGRMGCDLDLVLTNVVTEEMSDPSKRLVFQDKRCEGGARPWQRHMEAAGALLELRAAGAARLQRVLLARVPILKFAHRFAELDCDLCYNNMSGVYMSELVWLLRSLDGRAGPLTLAARRWAAAAGLTSPHPGRWITNFPLTLMVLFFLQQHADGGCVLPSLKSLAMRAGKEDVRTAEDNLNCTFLRDMNQLPTECYGQNQSDLGRLLLQFFEFYSQFDFQDKAISIYEGVPIRKPNSSPLYIVNPLEQTLNVSRNVSYEECERLKLEVRNAAWQLDAATDKNEDDWGLLGIIEKKSTKGLKKLLRVGNSHRLVSVKDLFKETDEISTEDTLKSKLERLTKKSDKDVEKSVKEMKDILSQDAKERKEQKTNPKYKNSQVASEVFRIRRDKIV